MDLQDFKIQKKLLNQMTPEHKEIHKKQLVKREQKRLPPAEFAVKFEEEIEAYKKTLF